MKLKDFLQKTFEQGDVRGDDVAAMLGASALAEIEIPDTAVTKFNESYLTRARAENDVEITKKIKGTSKAEVLDAVDKEIEKLLSLVDSSKAGEIQKNTNTFKKFEQITEAVKEAITNTKSSKDRDVQKIESEWAEKTKALETAKKAEIEELTKRMQKEKMDFVLKTKILSNEFGEAFVNLKEPIAETIIRKIETLRVKDEPITLELDQSGNVNVRHLVEGTLRDVYRDGNEKLTIDMLLHQELDPFIKKSTGKTTEDTNSVKTKTKDVDYNTATLRDIQWANAQQ